MSAPFIHPTALVEEGARLGEDTKIWHHAQIRARAVLGARCIVGKGAFVDVDVAIGDDAKLQNYACLYHGVTLGRGVFVGPHAIFTNDLHPRSTDPDFAPLRDGDWEVTETRVGDGAAIGANATVVAGSHVGAWAMVGAGSVVTRPVDAYALVVGSPARRIAWLCRRGRRVDEATRRCACCSELPADHPLAVASAGQEF